MENAALLCNVIAVIALGVVLFRMSWAPSRTVPGSTDEAVELLPSVKGESIEEVAAFVGVLKTALIAETPRLTDAQKHNLQYLNSHLMSARREIQILSARLLGSETKRQWQEIESEVVQPVLDEIGQLLGEDPEMKAADLCTVLRAHLRRAQQKDPDQRVTAVLQRWDAATTRDFIAALLDRVGEQDLAACRSDSGPASGALERLCKLGGLSMIVPRPGDDVDHARHEFEPTGRKSAQRRGTVATLLRRGYEWNGQVFRRARIEVSAGQDVG